LWNNKIKTVKNGTFDGLKDLEVLDFDGNVCVDDHASYNQTKLKELINGVYSKCK
jgi:hypothetical protein